MNILNENEEIKSLLAKGKIENAIDQLIAISQYEDQEVYQSLVLLKARFNKVKRDQQLNLIGDEDFSIEQNRIVSATLSIANNFSIDPNKLKISEIRNLIAQGKLDKSLNALQTFYQEVYPNNRLELENEIMVLRTRFQKLANDISMGVLPKGEENREYNILFKSVLALLDKIGNKTDIESIQSEYKEESKKESKKEIFKSQEPTAEAYQREIGTEIDPYDEISHILRKETIDLYAEMEQVKPVFGDLFKATFDLMVIPKSERGDISPSMEEGMLRMGYVYEYKAAQIGTIELLPVSSKRKVSGRVCYAISVETENKSTLKIIKQLGSELGKISRGSEGFKNIVAPLLGTGQGGLDKVQVFQTMERSFKSTCDEDATLSIHILDKEIFDIISKSKRNKFLGIFNNTRSRFDTDSVAGEDHLDISHEVDSFANLIVSSELKPPLSIGLFGNWGTGKSFFMEKLFYKVKDLSGKANSEKDYTGICKNIVQVKFNAWYYVDANLWASMVANIFEKLSEHLGIKDKSGDQEAALYEQLASIEQQVKIAEDEASKYNTEISALDTEIARLKDERKKKRQKLEGIRLKHILKEIKKDTQVAGFLKNAQEQLGFAELKGLEDSVQRSVDDVEGLIQRYQSTHGRTVQVFQSIFNFKNPLATLLLLLFLVVPFVAYHLILVTGITLFIRKTINIADPVLQNVNTGVEYLNKAKSRLQNLQDTASSEFNDEIAQLEKEYEKLNEQHQKAIGQN